jgi:hypothetical protein
MERALYHAEPEDPFVNEPDGIWSGFPTEVPPEAYKDPDQLANEQLIASIEWAEEELTA